MDRPRRSKTNYSDVTLVPYVKKDQVLVLLCLVEGGDLLFPRTLTLAQKNFLNLKVLPPNQDMLNHLYCDLTSRAVSPNRQDSPSLMNPVLGSSNAHNLAYERSSTSRFSSRAQSPSRESVISMSDTYSNASFSHDTTTRTPRYVKPSIYRRQTRAPSPEPEEPPQETLAYNNRSQSSGQSSPATVIGANQYSFLNNLYRLLT